MTVNQPVRVADDWPVFEVSIFLLGVASDWEVTQQPTCRGPSHDTGEDFKPCVNVPLGIDTTDSFVSVPASVVVAWDQELSTVHSLNESGHKVDRTERNVTYNEDVVAWCYQLVVILNYRFVHLVY
jgi:hypothetical protein